MQTFKRIFCALLIFIVTFTSVSVAVIYPFVNSETEFFQDSKLRQSLAGTIDCVVLGASQGVCSFVPEIMDKELGVNSYNLCSAMIPMYARKYLLEKELKRNNIQTVIIDLSYNTLNRSSDDEYGNGDVRVIEKLDSFGERLYYMYKYIKINDWLNIYSRLFINSLNGIETRISKGTHNVNYEAKGFDAKKATDITLSPEEAAEIHNTEKVSIDYFKDNVEQLTEIIDLCKSNGIRVIVAVVPLSDRILWKYESMDSFREWAENYCHELNCEFYDFNLLKNRYSLFNESNSWYSDASHMSEIGARAFTAEFSEVIKQVNLNQDINDLFYPSYNEMLKHSPYNK